jgi:hypothetical protein
METFKVLKKNLIESQMSWWLSEEKLYLQEIYTMVEEIYPNLCDYTLVRPDDGKTVEWKHYTRFALEKLKKMRIIKKVNPRKRDGLWVKI